MEMEKANYDDKTGQLLFNPVISKMSDENNRDVWTELFHEKMVLESKKKQAYLNQEKEFDVNNKTKLVSEKSQEINSQLKNCIFKKLFEYFDSDKDNLISHDDITQANLTAEILSLLDGVHVNMKSNDTKLNEEDFIKTLDQVEKSLKYEEKSKLFNWYHKEKLTKSSHCTMNDNNIEKHSFSPEINKRSCSFYTGSQRYEKNFMQRNANLMKNKQAYINTKKQEKDTLEMQECTFSPKISKMKNKSNNNTLNTATIVSKNTNVCTYRTDMKSTTNRIEDEKKTDFKTINIEDQQSKRTDR